MFKVELDKKKAESKILVPWPTTVIVLYFKIYIQKDKVNNLLKIFKVP